MHSKLEEDLERRALVGEGKAQVLLAQELIAIGQRDRAEWLLRNAVSAGDAEAMAVLGQHLLTRPGAASKATIDEGRRLITTATDLGNGNAAHFGAIMHAIERNWSLSLDYLYRPARAGYTPAQAELAVLAGDGHAVRTLRDGEALPRETLSRLHGAINPNKLAAIPPARVISADPAIAVVENFVSSETCDWLIQGARPKLMKAQAFTPPAISESQSSDGSVARYPLPPSHSAASPELDLVTLPLLQRIAAMTGLPITGTEPTSVLHYAVGEEYQPHYDFLDPASPGFAAQIASNGQRYATALIYLSDDFEGGETDFPKLGFRFKGRKGDALLFRNVDTSGNPNRRTLHAGLSPTLGEKWLFARACTHRPR
jgi:prolyl 4-hydroxylase